MPDRTLEQRMTEIEEGFASMQQEWLNIPDVIDARLRLTDSRVARLSSDMVGVKRSLAELSGKVEALPRTLAEMVAELSGKVDALPATLEKMLAERDKGR
jgi:hypothetical protein